ncbi:MAG: T9SS type B sorting domain-containing protein, partial [Saprospiraceae bacterium]|nr:T9SS type B sorting domain-containing protein [Saprospiraceae bacterium]
GSVVATADYGTDATFTLPADGAAITAEVRDVDDNACSEVIDLGTMDPCSNTCDLTVDNFTSTCDDNGTPVDATDDFFNITVNASAINHGATGQFEVVVNGNIVATADYGTDATFVLPADRAVITAEVRDVDDNACNETIDLGTMDPCSNTCDLTVDNFTSTCDDNGTPVDASDDFFNITVNASAINQGATGQFEVVVNGNVVATADYGTDATFTLPADRAVITAEVRDVDDNACNETIDLGTMDPCSNECEIVISNVITTCDDNGTPSDASDDFYNVSFDVSGTNNSSDYQVIVDGNVLVTNPYSQSTIISLPADGNVKTITVQDVSDVTCSAAFDTDPLTSCSDVCSITITNYSSECNDGNTPSDPSDDDYTITFDVEIANPGPSNKYTVKVDGTQIAEYDYGTTASIVLPADENSHVITVEDKDEAACNDSIDTEVLITCSDECLLTLENIQMECNNGGTPSDPSDDFYEVSAMISILNGGNSGQVTVTVDGNNMGSYDYGSLINFNIDADNLTHEIIFTDADKGTCNFSYMSTPLTTCSDECLIDATIISETCFDNGTPSDASDDYYLVEVEVDILNPGTTGQYTISEGSVVLGTFNYGEIGTVQLPADGNIHNLSIADIDDSLCEEVVATVSLSSCSNACLITIDSWTADCNDNGTLSDPSDDVYDVSLIVAALNGSLSNQYNVKLGQETVGTFTYGEMATFQLPIQTDASLTTITVEDVDDVSCSDTADLGVFATCSELCVLDAPLVSDPICDDNNTGTDPSDDTYTFTVNVSGLNTAGTWTADDLNNTSGTYGTDVIFGPYLISAGPLDITIVDDQDAQCSQVISVTPPEPCSDDCALEVVQAVEGICNDNNTGTTTDDDFYSVTLEVNAINLMSPSQYMVSHNGTQWGPFDYNIEIEISPLPADGQDIELTITNIGDDCSASVVVNQSSCSECVESIDAGIGGEISCDLASITLTATPTAPGNVTWEGPNNTQFDGEVIEASIPGWYYATVVFDNLCTAIDSVEITINDNVPVADPGPDQMITCLISEVTLDGSNSSQGPDITYRWTDEQGNTISTENQVTVDQVGIYYLTVYNSESMCESPAVPVTVHDRTNEPSALILADPDDVINCLVSSILLYTPTEEHVIYTWIMEDGRQSEGVSVMVEESGMVTLVVRDTITGCTNFNDFTIQDRVEYPLVNIDQPDPLSCETSFTMIDASNSQTGPSIVHRWFDSNGDVIEGADGLTLDVSNSGTYYLESMDTLNGCINIDTVMVDEMLMYPEVNAGPDQLLNCSDNTASLDGQVNNHDNGVIRWYTNDGLIVSGQGTMNPTVGGEGWYYLEVINGVSGCISLDSVLVNPIPNVLNGFDVDLSRPVCIGEVNGTITVTGFEGGTAPYEVSFNGSDYTDQRIFTDLRAGSYNITIRDANGCIVSDNVILADGNLIDVDVAADIDYIKIGESVVLSGNTSLPEEEIAEVLWTPEESVDCPDCMETTATPYETTRYTFTVTDINGCSADANIDIRVDRRAEIYVPNIFTPNDDGENDFFTVYSSDIGNIREIKKLLIFDRWGELVARIENFQPNLPELGWDGTFLGKPVNPGVFVYLVEAELIDGTTKKLTGDVTVLR